MGISKNTFRWSAAFAGITAVGLSILRRQREITAAERLRDKVVLITGGSRGLGFAIAAELAARGARLVLTARDANELERAKARLVETGAIAAANVFVQVADVSRMEEMRALVEAASQYFGQIDIVVNNAGVIFVGPAESQTLDTFHQAMNINFYGALHTTLAVLPQMLERGEGAIVNIASIGGKVAFPHLLPYVASKFALTGWSEGLRAELSSKGIHVTTVIPGVLRTGSHIQAKYAGKRQEEYRWFAAAASFPASATAATRAARKIVKALIRNSAEVAIGIQAIAAGRLAGLAPEVTAAFLATANHLLPEPPAQTPVFTDHDQSIPGSAYRGSLWSILETFGDRAILQYNQEGESDPAQNSNT